MKRIIIGLVILFILLTFAWSASAQSEYELLRSIVSSGGGRSQGGEYTLQTVINPFSHNTPIQGESFSIQSGFLPNNDDSSNPNNFWC